MDTPRQQLPSPATFVRPFALASSLSPQTAERCVFSPRGGVVTAAKRDAAPALLAAIGAVALLVAVAWYALATARVVTIGPAAYARIGTGMRQQEVGGAIGLPPGDYRDRAHRPGGSRYTEWSEEVADDELGAADAVSQLRWEGNQYGISVGFDEAGVVTWKTLWRHVPPAPRGPGEQVRAWLGW